MQSGINPVTSMWLNIAIAVLGVIAASSAALTTIFGTSTAQTVVTVAGLMLAALGSVNTALHGYSSASAGPGTVIK